MKTTTARAAPPGEYWWVQWRPEGCYYARRAPHSDVPLQEGECPDLESLPAPPGARVALCVPGAAVRVHAAGVPTRNRRRFLAALPFALEERLLHPPESCHFVPLARPMGSNPTPAAVAARERMAGWIEGIEKQGWRLDVLTPEYLLMPEPAPDAWLLDVAAAPMLLRFPKPGGGAALAGAPAADLPGALALALEQAWKAPARLEVRIANQEQREQVESWRERLRELGAELQLVQDNTPRNAWLARQAPPPGGNLLTGEYAPRRGRLPPLRRFIPAAALAAALLAVLGTQWLLDAARTRDEHERLSRDIETVYRQAFPNARNLVDPRHQMEQRLIAGRTARETPAAQNDILAWLEELAPFMGAGADVRLASLDYDGARLELELVLPDFAALEKLQKQLAGFSQVRVEETRPGDDGMIRSRIYLERPA